MSLNPVSAKDLKVISEVSRVKSQDIATLPRDALTNFIRSINENQQETEPFYVLDLRVVIGLMEKWNQSLPNVKPFYAVKCNCEAAILVALATLGANFDCGSKAEIETILGLGYSPERILYANPCKAISHIKYAAKVGVNLTTFDSKEEVNKIKKWHPHCRLLLRLKVPNDDHLKMISSRSINEKFGAFPDEIGPLLQHAHQAGLQVLGVSFHVGYKASEAKIFRTAISAARFVFSAAAELKMPPMHILNIGGGFRDIPLFDEIAKTVNDSIQEYFPDEKSVSVIAEPGRFFVETAFTMVTNVIGKRVIRGEAIQYWIDDGIYGSFNLAVYDRSSMILKPLLLQSEDGDCAGSEAAASSTIFGPTCDALDIVVSDCKLVELQVGDLVVFYNMGAYTTSPATKFNGFNGFAMPTYLAYTTPN